MKTRRLYKLSIPLLGGCTLLQGCPAGSILSGIISDCFGEDTISANEFDDLNVIEQLLWEENDCGRYEQRSL